LLVYVYLESEDRIVVVTIQDAVVRLSELRTAPGSTEQAPTRSRRVDPEFVCAQ